MSAEPTPRRPFGAAEDDPRRLLSAVAVIVAAGAAFLPAIYLLSTGNGQPWPAAPLLFLAAGVGGLLLSRAGRFAAGGRLLVGLLAAGVIVLIVQPLLGAGLSAPGVLSAVAWLGVLAVASTLLLGWRGAAGVAVGGLAVLAAAMLGGEWDTRPNSLAAILTVAVSIAVLALVLYQWLRAAGPQATSPTNGPELAQKQAELQEQVTERTAALAAAATVGNQISRMQDLDSLLRDAAELIRDRFRLVHVQVYLLSPGTQELILRAATGETGAELLRHNHRLAVGPGSINGTAAAALEAVTVRYDRGDAALPAHSLLPETQSEIALPLIFEDEVIGTLDLQSPDPDGLGLENLTAFSVLADQLATAVENARLFTEVTEAREQLARQAEALTRDGWRRFMAERAAEDSRPNTDSTPAQADAGPAPRLRQPIGVRGTTIGYVEMAQPAAESPRAKELVSAVAGQLGAHLENLRLTQQAETARDEARRRELELVLLNRVVSAIAASSDLHSSLQLIVDQLAMATGIQQVGVAILNEEHTGLEVVADRSGSLNTESAVGFVIPLENNPATQMAIAERRPIVVHHATENPLTASAHEVLRQRGVKTILILPLVVENEVIGTIGLDVVEEGIEMTDDQLRLAETIVYQAASAIQRARLFNQVRARSRQLESLSRMEADLSLATTEEEILLALAGGPPWGQLPALELTYLSPGADDVLRAEPAGLVRGGAVQAMAKAAPRTVASIPLSPLWIEKRREMLIIEDAATDPRLDETTRARLAATGQAAVVALPLRRGGQWQGLLTLSWPQPYQLTSDEAFILQRLHEPLAATVASRRAYLAQRAALAQTEAALAAQARLSRELRAVSDVGVAAAATLDVDRLLSAAVDLTKENFNLYHAHIYLLDEDKTTLALRAGAGAIGRQMVREGRKIPMYAQSIVARAARERDVVVVSETGRSTDFLPHPLLPDTRSELAVPLVIGDRLLGVLDVQSSQSGRFQATDRQVYRILAAQLAVATQNAIYFGEQLQMAEKLREVDRLKTDFLARMSHELRTPLNSIIGFADVLLMGLEGDLNERMIEDLQLIRGSGFHLRDIIGDILDMSRIEAGRLELTYETFDLRRTATEMMATAAPLAEQKGLALRLDIDQRIGLVSADRTRLRQVLWNIVGNAIKFTDHGGITVSIRPENGDVLVCISDTGIGIAAENLPRIFDHFSQVEGTHRQSIGGTGLGLSISKSLVELHGGRLWVDSRLGEGSTFRFTIPGGLRDDD